MAASITGWAPWARTVALGVIAGVLGWALAPDEETPAAVVGVRRYDWRPLVLPRGTDQAALAAAVAGAAYWGGGATAAPAATATAPPPDPRWWLSGVFGTERQRGALVTFADPAKPVARVFVGDKLPTGHRIVSIGEREVCVQIGRQTLRLGVERREP